MVPHSPRAAHASQLAFMSSQASAPAGPVGAEVGAKVGAEVGAEVGAVVVVPLAGAGAAASHSPQDLAQLVTM